MRTGSLRTKRYFFLFTGYWFCLYILWPQWAPTLVPGGIGRLMILLALLLYFSWQAMVVLRWLPEAEERAQRSKGSGFWDFIRANWELFTILLFSTALHVVFAIQIPAILPTDNAHYHYFSAYAFWHKFNTVTQGILGLPFLWIARVGLLLLAVAGFLVGSMGPGGRLAGGKGKIFDRPFRLWTVAMGMSIAYYGLITVSGVPIPPEVFDYPPLVKIFYNLSFVVLGVKVTAARLVQTFFMFSTGLLVYKITLLYRSRQVALLSTTLFLFLPAVFYWGHLVETTAGDLFFVTLPSYFFLKHLKYGRPNDLVLAMWSVSVGFAYRVPTLYLLGAFWAYWIGQKLLSWCRGSWGEFRQRARFTWLALIPVIPSLIITTQLTEKEWQFFDPSRLFSFTHMTAYIPLIPWGTSWPIFALFVSGLTYAFIARRDGFTGFLMAWFAGYYVMYSIWSYQPEHRYAVTFYAPIAIMSAQIVVDGLACLPRRWLFPVVHAALALYLLVVILATDYLRFYSWTPVGFPSSLIARPWGPQAGKAMGYLPEPRQGVGP